MNEGELLFPVRQAQAFYLLRQLRLDYFEHNSHQELSPEKRDPQEQQIVLLNPDILCKIESM